MNKPTTLIFFTYPLPSSQILIQLDSNKLINHKTNIVGDTSWIFELSAIKPIGFILKKSNKVVTQSFVNLNLMENSSFYKEFTKLQHRPPDILEAITYDMTRFSTQCYKKTIKGNKFSNKAFLTCLNTTHYQGITGPMAFTPNSPYAMRKSQFINLLDWL